MTGTADEDFDLIVQRVRDDAGLRAVLKTARTWGISPRRFMGWEPRQTFAQVYENDRLVRAVVTTEIEWDDDSRNLAMAFAVYESDLCPGCSQPMSETTLAENEGAFIPGPAIRCHWCTVSNMASEMYAEAPHAQALFVPVVRRGINDNLSESDGDGRSETGIAED